MEAFYAKYLPEVLSAPVAEFQPDKFYRTRLLMFFSILPAVVMLLFAWQIHPAFLWGWGVFAVMAPVFIFKYVASMNFQLMPEGLHLEKGWIFKKGIDVKLYKIQNITLSQTLFMERRNLYTLALHTAAGTVTLPFLQASTAFELSNFLLYKVSCSNRKWM
jgi:membrane protein YdbS with pleckstrin-like domain